LRFIDIILGYKSGTCAFSSSCQRWFDRTGQHLASGMHSRAALAWLFLFWLIGCFADRDPNKWRNFKSNRGRGAAVELGAPKLRRIKQNAAYSGDVAQLATFLNEDPDVVSSDTHDDQMLHGAMAVTYTLSCACSAAGMMR
jgi:hypothetical protein